MIRLKNSQNKIKLEFLYNLWLLITVVLQKVTHVIV